MSVDTTLLVDAALALLLWAEDEDGEDDVVVCHGIIRVAGMTCVLERQDGNRIELLPEWLQRIKPVAYNFKDMLGDADFMLSLPVGDVPDDADESEFTEIGIRIPHWSKEPKAE